MALLVSHSRPVVTERVRPNGMTIELRRAPLPSGGFVTLVSDITARKEAEAAQSRARAAAEAAAEEKSRFAAIVSHEIRTPLNMLLNSVEILAQSGLAAEKPRGRGVGAAGGAGAARPAERYSRAVQAGGGTAQPSSGVVRCRSAPRGRARSLPSAGRRARGDSPPRRRCQHARADLHGPDPAAAGPDKFPKQRNEILRSRRGAAPCSPRGRRGRPAPAHRRDRSRPADRRSRPRAPVPGLLPA